jgi:hypothetical protein
MNTWTKDYIADYPCIDKKDLKLCYHNNYWDGPISGVLIYGGERYYFDQCDENDTYETTGDRWSRRYLIYELTKSNSKKKITITICLEPALALIQNTTTMECDK